ncbi:geranylgeranylglycerol-phosphate geranylgeranyltransferase [Nocardia sp. CA-129566]|uniref:geranylgeranylglycerol-phosphate geranylgeranyltransferase n=1 Tax=Nocardia sp. CA-129566 TaxID=3239976 RepID=UPI003D97C2A5
MASETIASSARRRISIQRASMTMGRSADIVRQFGVTQCHGIRILWTLTRGPSCMGGAGCAILGMHLSNGIGAVGILRAITIVSIVSAIIAGANVVNDIVDADLDRMDKPERAIPSGECSLRTAWLLAWLFTVGGCVLAFSIVPMAGIVATAASILAWLYSFQLKATVLLGNIVVATLDAYCVAYGAIWTGGLRPPIVMVAVMVFFFCLVYLVLLTIRDRASDGAADVRTVATILSERASILVFRGLAVICIALSLSPWVFGWFSNVYLGAILVTSTLPLITAMCILDSGDMYRRMPTAIGILRLAWFPGMAALALAPSV